MRYRIIAEDRLAELLKEELLLHRVICWDNENLYDIAEDYQGYMSKDEYNDIVNRSDEEWTNIFPISENV